jgi:hypothetical protein
MRQQNKQNEFSLRLSVFAVKIPRKDAGAVN